MSRKALPLFSAYAGGRGIITSAVTLKCPWKCLWAGQARPRFDAYSFILKILRRIPPRSFGDLTTTIFKTVPSSHLRRHAMPQPISSRATRNSSAPTGNTAAHRIPSPSARAQPPRSRHHLHHLISGTPSHLAYGSIYMEKGKGALAKGQGTSIVFCLDGPTGAGAVCRRLVSLFAGGWSSRCLPRRRQRRLSGRAKSFSIASASYRISFSCLSFCLAWKCLPKRPRAGRPALVQAKNVPPAHFLNAWTCGRDQRAEVSIKAPTGGQARPRPS